MKRDPVDMMSVTAGPTVRVLNPAFCEANIQTTRKSENVLLKDMKICKSDVVVKWKMIKSSQSKLT